MCGVGFDREVAMCRRAVCQLTLPQHYVTYTRFVGQNTCVQVGTWAL